MRRERAACQEDALIRDNWQRWYSMRIAIVMARPSNGVMFHIGDGQPMDLDKLAQSVIRSVAEAAGIEWYSWHGFRNGNASNL
jgi:hypothetical protein